jgi:glucosyl-dolichyl phosphate glucuronosyltransferase
MADVSIIIPTRNRAVSLAAALESIAKQTVGHNRFEVLVVDNGSTDHTANMVDGFRASLPNLRYFLADNPGLHVGRHKGLFEAKAEILSFIDDDVEVFQTWLEGIAKAFEDPEVVLVGGKILPKFETTPPQWLKRMWTKKSTEGYILGYLSLLDLGQTIKEISPNYVFGCNFSIRKSIVLNAKGFHPDGMPQAFTRFRGDGETHISKYVSSKKYKALYNPKASVYHRIPAERMTETYFLKRAYNQGISNSYTLTREGRPKDWLKLNYQKFKHMTRKFLGDRLEYRIRQAYFAGFDYHQKEVKKDRNLYEWVTRETYLDTPSPIIKEK